MGVKKVVREDFVGKRGRIFGKRDLWVRRSSKPLCGEAQGGMEVGEGVRTSQPPGDSPSSGEECRCDGWNENKKDLGEEEDQVVVVQEKTREKVRSARSESSPRFRLKRKLVHEIVGTPRAGLSSSRN